MKLQTKIPITKVTHNQIDYTSKILVLGSCFSENIGKKLGYFKFHVTQNPFGILFHPKAIEKVVLNAINTKEYLEKDIFFHQERWHSFFTHSSLSSPNKTKFLSDVNTASQSVFSTLKTANHIIITLGTSWVYRHIESDTIVANCHKIPQKKFLKELLSVPEIIESLDATVQLIKSINTKVTILFTVSPVRHLKDGFIENTQSKAHLIAAIHHLINVRNNIHYFPSYEIMIDELREYRFYAEDMIHPNQIAIHYIWERFAETWFAENTKPILKAVDSIQKGMQHKPFYKDSEEHKQFLQNLEAKKERLQNQFPFIQF
ncbi:GSCFA domain-containing protein [uncultured Polaribacter sp.]|uniref:GSCFA domain-containing protein n=1 Tax=uncultured Polaribacter sp. TaxID=174711 RepID=UPI002622369A|nr:GSCFA domain-containing protein [uncultured Polaribacter sp.]